MFKKIADMFASLSANKEASADALRAKTKNAQPPGVPDGVQIDDKEVLSGQVKPAKRLSDVSQMRLAAYVERTGNTE